MARKQITRVDDVRLKWQIDADESQSIEATATVSYPMAGSKGDRRLEDFHSGGLYAVDRPSTDYCNELEDEQLDELRSHLSVFGVKVDTEDWRELRRRAKNSVTRYVHD